jgi:hypothetical protein
VLRHLYSPFKLLPWRILIAGPEPRDDRRLRIEHSASRPHSPHGLLRRCRRQSTSPCVIGVGAIGASLFRHARRLLQTRSPLAARYPTSSRNPHPHTSTTHDGRQPASKSKQACSVRASRRAHGCAARSGSSARVPSTSTREGHARAKPRRSGSHNTAEAPIPRLGVGEARGREAGEDRAASPSCPPVATVLAAGCPKACDRAASTYRRCKSCTSIRCRRTCSARRRRAPPPTPRTAPLLTPRRRRPTRTPLSATCLHRIQPRSPCRPPRPLLSLATACAPQAPSPRRPPQP